MEKSATQEQIIVEGNTSSLSATEKKFEDAQDLQALSSLI